SGRGARRPLRPGQAALPEGLPARARREDHRLRGAARGMGPPLEAPRFSLTVPIERASSPSWGGRMQEEMQWFVKPAAMSGVILAAMLLRVTASSAEPAPSNPCAGATSVAVLAGPEEPGERLVVTGTVFAPDGVTPAPGVFLYVYNTDATGHYNSER